MAHQASSPDEAEQTKSRIIKHMNKDHVDSLALFLEEQHCIASIRARHARMTSVNFSSLSITVPSSAFVAVLPSSLIPSYFNKSYGILIDPPMQSWADSRTTFKLMDLAARSSLSRSPVTIKQYTAPNSPLMWTFLIATLLTLVAFARPSHFDDDAFVGGTLIMTYLSSGLQLILGDEKSGIHAARMFLIFCRTIQTPLMIFIVVLHLGEAAWMARTRLRRHNIPVGSSIWWFWMVDTFAEGMGAFIRFDQLVRAAEDKASREEKARMGKAA